MFARPGSPLRGNAIDPAAPLHLVRDDGEPKLLLERTADGAAHRGRLPASSLHHLGDGGASLALQEIEEEGQFSPRAEGGGRCRLLLLRTERGPAFRLSRLASATRGSFRVTGRGVLR